MVLTADIYTITQGPAGLGGGYVATIYENTDELDILAQPHGCNGNINFNAATFTGPQDSTIDVDVTRTKGAFGPVTGVLATPGGTAVNGTDYTITPTRLFWEPDEVSGQTFTVTTINGWAEGGLTIDLVFSSIEGGFTGTVNPETEVTITNVPIIESQSATPYTEISSDFTINTYRNLTSDYKHKGGQVPFSLGIKGPSTLRGITTAYSTSLGKTS